MMEQAEQAMLCVAEEASCGPKPDEENSTEWFVVNIAHVPA
jgi:hypothetical protein